MTRLLSRLRCGAAGPRPARPSRGTRAIRRIALAAALLGAGFGSPEAVEAQGFDAPRLIGPYSPLERGALWTRLPESEGGGDGVLATWRPRAWNTAFSVRAGGVFGSDADRGFAGLDVRAPVYLGETAVIWTSGLGASFGEVTRVNVPVQLSASQAWSTGSLWVAPFFSAGASLEWRDDGGDDIEEFTGFPVLELGLDITVDPRRRWVVRGGAGLLGRKGFAVGLALPH